MFMTPGAILFSWIRGLLAVAIVVGGIWLAIYWYRHLPQHAPAESRPVAGYSGRDPKATSDKLRDAGPGNHRQLSPLERISVWKPGLNWQTAALAGVLGLSIWGALGRFIHPAILAIQNGRGNPPIRPGETQRLKMLNGSALHTESRGPTEGPTVILTHGWSLSSREWDCLQEHWEGKVRTVVWDLPGLGKSTQPTDRDFSLETMARALRAVVDVSTAGPVILIGHSIGGMIILTFCRLFPELLGTRVSKLVLIHTTYVNPLRTMRFSGLFTGLQKPLVEPLLYLQIALSPLVRVLNWLSYWNGTIHSSALRNGFTWSVSRQKVNFVAGYYPYDSPAVLARGALGMLKYDATDILPKITVPVLIVGAEHDPITLNEASEHIHKQIKGSQLKVLASTKHFGLIEYDEETSKVISDFCST